MAIRFRDRFSCWTMLVISGASIIGGCGRAPAPVLTPPHPATAPPAPSVLGPIALPHAPQRPGTAVVVLIDTSGSMGQKVRDASGRERPKHDVARDALAHVVQVTEAWHSAHPTTNLQLGIVNFSGVTTTVLPMGPFDAAAAREAIARIPAPAGGTAIGLALEEGFKALYGTGSIRKHLVCITDGENSVATPPDLMARQLHSQTGGDVELHFVAFDTSSQNFAFLKQVNGTVEEADGAGLQKRLAELYEKRILVEAMPAEKE